MAKKTPKPKPFDPAAAQKRIYYQRMANLGAVGMQIEAAALIAHADVEVTRAGETRPSDPDGKKVDADSARRLDAFEALRHGMQVGAYDAARRLERDILVSLGQHDHGRPVERVQHEQAAYCRVDAMIDASRRCLSIKARLADRDAWLLWELIAPTRPWLTWRDTVAYITAETNHNAQGAAVRSACVNLRDTYQRLDMVGRQAA